MMDDRVHWVFWLFERSAGCVDDRGRRWTPMWIGAAAKELGVDRSVLASGAVLGVWRALIVACVLGTLAGVPWTGMMWLFFRLLLGMPAGNMVVLPSGVLFGVAFGLAMAAFLARQTWASAGAARAAMLGVGACPNCAFGIGGLPPEADGCVVCPECSAAWRQAG